ncbi:phage holin family protein [Glaciihabitans sp. GrIS 2.15]|uniref:phage holin family protein n=1 Tax=Glaciihabitans sp. GrIS 2.15 TaxID=3071710 RepID=UPI002DFAC293|nr:putative membrane protein [Glaciihabitans sp. GrIS 2.15]
MNDDAPSRKSIFALVADLPRLVIGQVKNEIEQFKSELIGKIKHAGIGVGLFAGAGFVAFFLFAVLISAAILAFATIMPGWLAALIVAGILLVIVVILVSVGLRQVKKGVPPAPTETIKSVKKDVLVIKGLGKRENR